jgi:DNA-binding NarL/FixJ family response regulator
VRVAIADDAPLFRDGVAHLLREAGVEVTAATGDAAGLLAAVAEDPPDAVILDVRMPPTHTTEGLDAALRLRRTAPSIAVLLLSQHVEQTHVADLLAGGGGAGYLLKERVADAGELVQALHRLVAGGTVVDPEVVTLVLGRRREAARIDRLTAREREVLALMAEGRSNRAIQERLVLSAKTVETHVGRIFAKLDLGNVPDDHRRVRAVLAHLDAAPPTSSGRPR